MMFINRFTKTFYNLSKEQVRDLLRGKVNRERYKLLFIEF